MRIRYSSHDSTPHVSQIVEFTLTTPGCLDQVANFRAKYDGKVMVGCGTVMDIPDAKAAMDAGAEFLVAPCLVPEVVTWAALNNIVIIPGCQARRRRPPSPPAPPPSARLRQA